MERSMPFKEALLFTVAKRRQQATPHGSAWENLQPGQEAEKVKEKV